MWTQTPARATFHVCTPADHKNCRSDVPRQLRLRLFRHVASAILDNRILPNYLGPALAARAIAGLAAVTDFSTRHARGIDPDARFAGCWPVDCERLRKKNPGPAFDKSRLEKAYRPHR